ncbi:MAG: hypothetical protein ACOCV4_00600 [Myxococcota bacterium]
MHRIAYVTILALALSPAATAGAQTGDDPVPEGNLSVFVLDVEGRDDNQISTETPLVALPIGLRECTTNVGVLLRIRNIPTDGSVSVLDFWRSSGTDCSMAANRSDDTQRGCENIELAGDQNTGGRSEVDLIIRADELMPGDDCTNQNGTFQLYILATGSTGSSSEVNGDFGVLEYKVDTVPPPEPTNVRARDGENQLGISWERASEENLKSHLILIDRSGCHDGTGGTDGGTDDGGTDDGGTDDGGTDGGSDMDAGALADAGLLDGGATADGGTGDGGVFEDPDGFVCRGVRPLQDIPDGFECAKEVGDTAQSASVSTFGVSIGEQVTLGVMAVDEANNTSELVTTCVTRIDTTGFCEARGGCPDTCAVRAPGGGAASGGGLAIWGLLAFILYVRRRGR